MDADFPEDRFVLDCCGKRLDCRPFQPFGARVMGILNVTPDSFSDGGVYLDPDAALRQAETMLEEGADIIDVGGESTRPRGRVYGEGAAIVSEEEERGRIIPVIRAIASRFPEAIVSVDTYKSAVAEAALEAGAHLVNDVTGLRLFPEMARVAAQAGAPIVLMHSVGEPGDFSIREPFDDVVAAVRASLEEAARVAHDAGVHQLVLDPGFGFGKRISENLRVINGVNALLDLGYPVLIGVSRKSTIGAVLRSVDNPLPPAERLYGSLGATAVGVLRGASIVRAHDVRATVEMVRVLGETLAATA